MSVATYWSSLLAVGQTIYNMVLPPSSKDTFVVIPPLGEAAWKQCFGSVDIGQVPPVPAELLKDLEEPSDFWPDKKTKETHIAVWFPPTVNKEPLLTSSLSKLLEPSKEGVNPAASFSIENEVLIKEGYWGLLTKRPIPPSSFLAYDKQRELVEKYPNYHLARAVEIGVSMLMVYYNYNLHLFSHDLSTRCEEMAGHWPIVAGSNYIGFGKLPFSIEVSTRDWDRPHGVAVIRRYYVSENNTLKNSAI